METKSCLSWEERAGATGDGRQRGAPDTLSHTVCSSQMPPSTDTLYPTLLNQPLLPPLGTVIRRFNDHNSLPTALGWRRAQREPRRHECGCMLGESSPAGSGASGCCLWLGRGPLDSSEDNGAVGKG